MTPLIHRSALVCSAIVATFAVTAAAQGQQVYRYVDKDGHVVYSDRQPPADSKEVQAKRLSPNFIENSNVPIAATQATERYPVKLYTFACGPICESAEALLNRRGVPFSTVNVEDAKGAEELKKLTGGQEAPVLQVGDKLVAKGFNEQRWSAMLDDAGYPKSPPRRVGARPQAPEQPPPPVPPPAEPAPPPQPGSGYPTQ